MLKPGGRINIDRIANKEKQKEILKAWSEMTYEQQQAYLKEIEEEQQECNRLSGLEKENQKSADDALLKASLGIEFLKLNGFPVTPTSLSQHASISRSYIYKNKKIKKMIDECRDYNNNLKQLETEKKKAGLYSPTDPKDDATLNYHLHVKLIESYINEYQTLKALNKFMEEKISDVKKQIVEKENL